MFTHYLNSFHIVLFSVPESIGVLASGVGLIAAAGSIRWALGRQNEGRNEEGTTNNK